MHRAPRHTFHPSPRPSRHREIAVLAPRRATFLWHRIGYALLLAAVSAAVAGLVMSGAPDRLLRLDALTGGTATAETNTAESNEAPVFLARATLMTLHDANRTGNYGVFRALAAPGFQASNSTEALARIFSGLRRENVDLSVAAIAPPAWDTGPGISADQLYRISGSFMTGRHAVRFALAYTAVEENWRLLEISVAAEPSPH